MKPAVVCLLLLAAGPASACIWSYGTDLRGEKLEINGEVGEALVATLRPHDDRRIWENHEKRYAKLVQEKPDEYNLNDYAVTLLHLGRTKEAIAILTQLEQKHPGSYVTAANLGTSYELAGDKGEALKWIREGIRRNRNAHDGTEWLHVRILEAKIAAARDRGWFERNSVLGLDFGTRALPNLPGRLPAGNSGEAVTLDGLKDVIFYQLAERYQFVEPPDPVVGSLLFDWANLLFRTDALESAIAVYREALRFGAPRAELVKARLARAEIALRAHAKR